MPDSPAVDGPGGPAPSADAARQALARARAAAAGAGPAPGNERARGGAPSTRRGRGAASGRDPVLTGEVLRQLAGEQGWSGPAAVAGLMNGWPEIVGAELAAHVRAESFDQESGRLLVRADSTTWATAVRMQLALLHRRIADQVGAGVVRSITVAGPAAPSWRHGPRVVRGRGPRDTYG